MNLDFSEEQDVLREMLRGVCNEYAPLEVVRQMEDDATGYPAEFWKQLGELGLLGIGIPEAYGGAQQSILESAIVYEELGRSLVPSPHFVSSVVAAGILDGAGSDDQRSTWLPRIASGEAVLSVAWLEPDNGSGPTGVRLPAVVDGDGFVLTGAKRHVPFASSAERLIVPARTGDGPEAIDLFLDWVGTMYGSDTGLDRHMLELCRMRLARQNECFH